MTNLNPVFVKNRKYKRRACNLRSIFCSLLFLTVLAIIIIYISFYDRAISKLKSATNFTNSEEIEIQNVDDQPEYVFFVFEEESSESRSKGGKGVPPLILIVEETQTLVVNETATELYPTTTSVTSDEKINFSSLVAQQVENATLPGIPAPRWCGFGSMILPNNLEPFEDSGRCCQMHDDCSQKIGFGETKFGLQNTEPFALSSCDCDDQFYRCLRESNKFFSNLVGFAYFTMFGSKCFKEDYSVFECTKEVSTLYAVKKGNTVRCVEYSFDEKSPKKYNLFDIPLYTM